MIAHPPCTYLTNSGNRWLSLRCVTPEQAVERWDKRAQAAVFFMQLMLAPVPRIAVENPIGYMSRAYRPPDQIINPYQFRGESECKATGLWLKNLPPLKPTEITPEGERTHNGYRAIFNGKQFAWNDEETAKNRSKTPWGVAAAMAEQWG